MQLDFLAKLTARAASSFANFRKPKFLGSPQPDAETLTARAKSLFKSIGYDALGDAVRIQWNPRMRSTAGIAFPSRAIVVLNPKIIDFGPAELDRTLRHELAHLLAHHRAGRRRIAAHGVEWQKACADLGLPGEKRCHDLPLPRRELKRQHHYRCPSCGMELNRVRPLRRGSACLACCKTHARGRYDARFRFVQIDSPAKKK